MNIYFHEEIILSAIDMPAKMYNSFVGMSVALRI